MGPFAIVEFKEPFDQLEHERVIDDAIEEVKEEHGGIIERTEEGIIEVEENINKRKIEYLSTLSPRIKIIERINSEIFDDGHCLFVAESIIRNERVYLPIYDNRFVEFAVLEITEVYNKIASDDIRYSDIYDYIRNKYNIDIYSENDDVLVHNIDCLELMTSLYGSGQKEIKIVVK